MEIEFAEGYTALGAPQRSIFKGRHLASFTVHQDGRLSGRGLAIVPYWLQRHIASRTSRGRSATGYYRGRHFDYYVEGDASAGHLTDILGIEGYLQSYKPDIELPVVVIYRGHISRTGRGI